jgi:hypothetical protein
MTNLVLQYVTRRSISKSNTPYLGLSPLRILGYPNMRWLPKSPRIFAVTSHLRLTIFGRAVILLSSELLANIAFWIVAGLLFARITATRGVMSLCMLAWVRPLAL